MTPGGAQEPGRSGRPTGGEARPRGGASAGSEAASEATAGVVAAATEAARAGSVALVRRIAALAEAKAATDLVALEIGDLVGYTDYLLICSVRNERQARAVHDSVYETLKKADGRLPVSVEGAREGRWVLMDYLDCVLHVLVPEMRDRYRLEQLWGEAPRLDLEPGGTSGAPGASPGR